MYFILHSYQRVLIACGTAFLLMFKLGEHSIHMLPSNDGISLLVKSQGLSVSQCASHCSGYHNTAVWNGVVCNKEKPLCLSSTVVIQLCFSSWWFFLFFCFSIGWIWCLWKWETSITGWRKVLHKHSICSSASAPLSFFFFFFFLFIYILFNLVLMKGAGLTTLEAEALYLPTEQIHHGRQLCKLPHAAPTNVPHLCPGGTTSRGERIVQSPWPIQSLAFLLRLPTKLQ